MDRARLPTCQMWSGTPVHQLTVRNQSTKDNVGTLPIFAYATPDPPQQPLNFSAMVDQTPRLARTESIAPSGTACRAILFEGNSVLIVKRDHIRRQSGVPTKWSLFHRKPQNWRHWRRPWVILTFNFMYPAFKTAWTSSTTEKSMCIVMPWFVLSAKQRYKQVTAS